MDKVFQNSENFFWSRFVQCSSKSSTKIGSLTLSLSIGNGSLFPMYTCTNCGRKRDGKCLADLNGCSRFGRSGLKMRDYPMLKDK